MHVEWNLRLPQDFKPYHLKVNLKPYSQIPNPEGYVCSEASWAQVLNGRNPNYSGGRYSAIECAAVFNKQQLEPRPDEGMCKCVDSLHTGIQKQISFPYWGLVGNKGMESPCNVFLHSLLTPIYTLPYCSSFHFLFHYPYRTPK